VEQVVKGNELLAEIARQGKHRKSLAVAIGVCPRTLNAVLSEWRPPSYKVMVGLIRELSLTLEQAGAFFFPLCFQQRSFVDGRMSPAEDEA
jgi:hypothetical protein